MLSFDPPSLDFGNVTVGTPYSLDCFIYNDDPWPVNITGMVTVDPYSQDLALGLLGANNGTTFHVTFTPTTNILYGGTLTCQSDASNAPIIIFLSGTGINPGSKLLCCNPSRWDFGQQKNFVASTEKIFTLKNNGTASLLISALNYTSPFSAGITQPALPYTLAAGSTVAVGVKFTPTGTGYVSVSNGLSIVSDATGSPLNITLIGTGYPLTPAYILGNTSTLVLAAFGNVVKQFAPSNLSCEEICSTDKLVNMESPTLEKTLYTIQVDYENLGVASLKVQVTDRRGDSPSQVLSIGNVGANNDLLRELADLQISEEVMHLQFSVAANAGPVSICGYIAEFEPGGEVRKQS